MNKKGQAIILIAWFLLMWGVLSIGMSFYKYSIVEDVCNNHNGKVGVDHKFFDTKYSCVINNTKYEMVEIVGFEYEIVGYDVNGGNSEQ